MITIPTLSHARIEKRADSYVILCSDPSMCERPLGRLSNGVHIIRSPHDKEVHVSVLTAEDHRLIADFLEMIAAESCERAA
jgi:hypothetical protein